jgi:hypothetical protein
MIASLPLAALAAEPFQVGRPLFGNQWLALLAASGLIALLLLAVALLGRWLAATHPAAAPAKITTPITTAAPPAFVAPCVIPITASQPILSGDVSPDLVPVIIAAVAATLGSGARVNAIRPVGRLSGAPSLEALMQQWSYEGRRQIYSSHKVR